MKPLPGTRLRVAMIAQRFWPRTGALETRAAQLACELADRGNEVTVVTARWHSHWPAEILFHGLPIVRLAPPPTGRWRAWRWARALARWLKQNENDLDAVLVWGVMNEAETAITAVRGQVPVVLVPERTGWHGDCFRQVRASGWRGIQQACRQAAAFVATSPVARRELEAAGYPRERIREVTPGVPPQPPRTRETQIVARETLADAHPLLQLATRAPLVVSTTRLAPERGWEWLLAAWSIVAPRKPAARLWLIGEAPQEAAVAARINSLRIAASVSLLGKFDDATPLLTAADVHVSPSPDGSLQPVLEAMSAGLPSVAVDVPLNRWLLGNGEAGILTPLDDAKALAAAILDLLDDEKRARQLGSAGWQRVQHDFTLQAMTDGFLEVIDSEIAAAFRRRDDSSC